MRDKITIRTQMRHRRQALSSLEQTTLSNIIVEKILTLTAFQSAKSIGLYQAFQNEVNLDALWEIAAKSQKTTSFPVISTDKKCHDMVFKSLDFAEALRFDALKWNHFQIKEPTQSAPTTPLETIDCLFVPLLAFDTKGYRLGMGKGYYDRLLARVKSFQNHQIIGVAYDFQKVDTLPHDSWDIPLDMVVTENHIYFYENSEPMSFIAMNDNDE